MKVSVSESVESVNEFGLKRWLKVSVEDEVVVDSPEEVWDKLYGKTQGWLQSKLSKPNGVPLIQYPAQNVPNSVIDRSTERQVSNTIEALSLDIQSCKDLKTIDSYRLLVKQKPELEEVFNKRRNEIVKVEADNLLKATEDFYKK